MRDVIEKATDSLKLDRSNWKLVKFGDVAIQKKEAVDRENTNLTRYVKGEHMYSEDLHLREWGELTDEYLGPAFIRKFSEGDILYGSRRTYLRKVIIAPFDGITSNTTFVVKANEKKIDKRLLPFIMLSEGFSQHSIRNSKGSVNPYVNWKDLSGYEFLLPPKDQQAELANLLLELDKAIESDIYLKNKLCQMLDVEIESKIHGINLLGKTINEVITELGRKVKITALGELGIIFKGKGIAKSDVVDRGVPCVRYGELYTKHHRIIRDFHSHVTQATADSSVKLKNGDVLFAGSGETITEIGKSAAFVSNEVAYAGSDIIVFRPRDMDGVYLGYLMNSKLIRQQLNRLGTGATVMHIYNSDIESVKVPVFSKSDQIKIGVYFERISNNISLLDKKIFESQSLYKNLINQVF